MARLCLARSSATPHLHGGASFALAMCMSGAVGGTTHDVQMKEKKMNILHGRQRKEAHTCH